MNEIGSILKAQYENHQKEQWLPHETKELIVAAIEQVIFLERQLAAEKEKHDWHKWPEEKPEIPSEYLVARWIIKGEVLKWEVGTWFNGTDGLTHWFTNDFEGNCVADDDVVCWQPIIGPEAWI